MDRQDGLLARLASGSRLGLEQWSALIADGPDAGEGGGIPTVDLIALADGFRQRLHPDHVVTYVVDRNIIYSNLCSAVCAFCAFANLCKTCPFLTCLRKESSETLKVAAIPRIVAPSLTSAASMRLRADDAQIEHFIY
jgi:hypothetical protein